ncbi:VOC family protein [Mycobacterium neumannii]|uniref:VOC family protein n=1 Tax=Mycobacterium neumannii TaxID=2048551 RepID=UPI003AB6F9CC
MSDGHRLTHIGLCVRDIGRAEQFYCSALGFEVVGRMTVDDDATAQLLDVPGLLLELVYLQRDGFRLELLGYVRPGTVGATGPRPMNTLGFTHLSFRVDDAERAVDAIVAHGGRALPDRTVAFGAGNRGLMATDPDGNLLELIERTPPVDR